MSKNAIILLLVLVCLQGSLLAQPGNGWGDPVYEDNFDGTSVNTSLWRITSYAEHKPDYVSVENGNLVLSSVIDATGDVWGGRIDTWTKRKFSYGYFETRCKIEYADDMIWPAVWLGDGIANTELDIFEYYFTNLAPNQSHHFTDDGYQITVIPRQYQPEDWHTYAVLWTPNEITFYIDGEFHYSSPNHEDATDEIYLLLTSSPNIHKTHSVGNTYPDFYVDYIRVWQKDDYSTTSSSLPEPLAIPGKIEGEAYIMPSGIQNVTDSGDGLAVGYTDNGDWMDYNVNIETEGKYSVTYRMATASSGSVDFLIDGDSKGVTYITNTGGWESWREFTNNIFFPAGEHTLRIQCASGSWNLDYLNLELIEAGNVNTTSIAVNSGSNNKLYVYPNPTTDLITIEGLKGRVSNVSVYNSNGQLILSKYVSNGVVNVAGLNSGLYYVKVSDRKRDGVIKFIKN